MKIEKKGTFLDLRIRKNEKKGLFYVPNLFLKGTFIRIIGPKFLYANLCSSDGLFDR